MLPLLMLLTVAISAPPAEADRSAPSEVAESLHRQALEHARKGDWEAAFPLWDEALRRHPVWKYAFNQASGYAHLERWLAAWRALNRTWQLTVPGEHEGTVRRLQRKVEAALLKAYAYVEVKVTPPGATFTLNEVDLTAPWTGWLARGSTTIRVTAEGYAAQDVTIDHPIGTRTIREVTLEKAD